VLGVWLWGRPLYFILFGHFRADAILDLQPILFGKFVILMSIVDEIFRQSLGGLLKLIFLRTPMVNFDLSVSSSVSPSVTPVSRA